jgi:hypothetical protein
MVFKKKEVSGGEIKMARRRSVRTTTIESPSYSSEDWYGFLRRISTYRDFNAVPIPDPLDRRAGT